MLNPDMDTAKAAYVTDTPQGGEMVTIIMQDGTVTHAILKPDEYLHPPLRWHHR